MKRCDIGTVRNGKVKKGDNVRHVYGGEGTVQEIWLHTQPRNNYTLLVVGKNQYRADECDKLNG